MTRREAAGAARWPTRAEPVAGVPTIPCSAEAMELFAGRPGAAGAVVRAAATGAGGAAVAGVPGARTRASPSPFDLVASAFVLLACWDEHTVAERDRFGRLPYSASVFAANPELRIEEPAVDGYVALLRAVLAPRLAELGLEPLPAAGWMWGRRRGRRPAGFAVALTHDLDNLWRWTPAGFAAPPDAARPRPASRRRSAPPAARLATCVEWLTRHLPHGDRPVLDVPPACSRGEDERGVRSTFYVIARHTARVDGNQPDTYARRIPAVLDLLRRGAPRGRPARQRRRPARRRRPGRRSRRPRASARGVAGLRDPLPLPALPLPRDAAAARVGRASSTTPASPSPSTRASAAALASPSARTPSPTSGRCACSNCRWPSWTRACRASATGPSPPTRRARRPRRAGAGARPAAAASPCSGTTTASTAGSAQGYDDVYWRLVDWTLARGRPWRTAAELARRWRERTGEAAA